MFKSMRRKEREVDGKIVQEILSVGQYGVLSLKGDTYAYGVPICYVYKNGCIYLHMAAEGQKLDLIKKNNKVSFCVVDKAVNLPEQFSMAYRSIIAFGDAEEVSGEKKQQALEMLIEKYASHRREQGLAYISKAGAKTVVIKIKVAHVTGKMRPEN